jgi:hypothetical protein
MMTSLNSISDFFSRIECPFQVYEMGRLILPISAATFVQFEHTQAAWPMPFLRQAWFAIFFWFPDINKQAESKNKPGRHYVWFLKFALDEQAKLNLANRDDFLQQLFSALEHYLASTETDPIKKFQSLEARLKDNSYGFTPSQERMASFHASVHQLLNLPASRFYRPTVEYLTGKNGFEQWNFVGYQGLADVAARLNETFNGTAVEAIVSQSIQQLPDEPLMALLNCLQNHSLSNPLTHEIIQRLHTELLKGTNATGQDFNQNQEVNSAIIASLIRGLARSTETKTKRQVLMQLLESEYGSDIEIIAAISAKCWPELKDPEIFALFLEALAKNPHGQNSFNAIISDLLFIPGMREVMLQQFRSPDRSPGLARAIGAFFQSGGSVNV